MDLESVESHTTEFKSSWRDEYLKWICAFANTNGGRLLIGVDDNGNPVGVKDSNKTAFLELSELTGKGLLEIHVSGRGVLYKSKVMKK